MKKQILVIMEQSRKSAEREKIALQQAQEALTCKEAAVTDAAQAASRENYMLELMNDASLDMAGMLPVFVIPRIFYMLVLYLLL
jgi:hypothetical protein